MSIDRCHRKPHQHALDTRERKNEARRLRRAADMHYSIRAYAMAHGLLTEPPPIPTLADLMRAIQ